MTTITTLAELAEAQDAAHPTKESIAHDLFKYTTCGVSFYVQKEEPLTVGVGGYCEGDLDNDIPMRWLTAPFTSEEWDAAIEAADKDGIDRWNETHGCAHCDGSTCPTHAACECEREEDDWGNCPINPDCAYCNGEGMIL